MTGSGPDEGPADGPDEGPADGRDDPSEQTGTDAGARARRRRLAAVFGDVLPEQTTDDAPSSAAPDGPERDRDDQWWRDQVPPHHD